MPFVQDRYTVPAPVNAVAAFHHSTEALPKLTPPPIIVQLHRVEPLAEGSISEFTLWFGPIPLRWKAIHNQVDPAAGFVDTQVAGPMAAWRHRHAWRALETGETEILERIEFDHKPGPSGWFTRVLFAPPLLRIMLAYRRYVIRRECRAEDR